MSLYDLGLASFGASQGYAHSDSSGFVKIFGLPLRAVARQETARPREVRDDGTRGREARPPGDRSQEFPGQDDRLEGAVAVPARKT